MEIMRQDQYTSQSTQSRTRSSPAPAGLTGAFIQYDGTTPYVPASEWDRVVEKMATARMDTIIVQYLHHVKKGEYDLNFLQLSTGVDPTAEVLAASARRHMKVWIGLWLDEEWW